MDFISEHYGTGGMVSCWLVMLLCTIGPLILTISLGIYAFSNPDNEAWYGMVDDKHALFANKGDGEAEEAQHLQNVHARFVAWFLWGFIMILPVPIASAVLIYIVNKLLSPRIASYCSVFNFCGGICSGLAWWCSGIVLRFRSDGAFASGDAVTPLDATKGDLVVEESLI